MKYVVLLVDYPEGTPVWGEMPEAQRQAYYDAHVGFAKEAAARPGVEILAGEALSDGSAATVMRPGADGKPVLTDGSYTESIELIGGFYLMEVDDLDALVSVCEVLPPYVIELRPVVDVG